MSELTKDKALKLLEGLIETYVSTRDMNAEDRQDLDRLVPTFDKVRNWWVLQNLNEFHLTQRMSNLSVRIAHGYDEETHALLTNLYDDIQNMHHPPVSTQEDGSEFVAVEDPDDDAQEVQVAEAEYTTTPVAGDRREDAGVYDEMRVSPTSPPIRHSIPAPKTGQHQGNREVYDGVWNDTPLEAASLMPPMIQKRQDPTDAKTVPGSSPRKATPAPSKRHDDPPSGISRLEDLTDSSAKEARLDPGSIKIHEESDSALDNLYEDWQNSFPEELTPTNDSDPEDEILVVREHGRTKWTAIALIAVLFATLTVWRVYWYEGTKDVWNNAVAFMKTIEIPEFKLPEAPEVETPEVPVANDMTTVALPEDELLVDSGQFTRERTDLLPPMPAPEVPVEEARSAEPDPAPAQVPPPIEPPPVEVTQSAEPEPAAPMPSTIIVPEPPKAPPIKASSVSTRLACKDEWFWGYKGTGPYWVQVPLSNGGKLIVHDVIPVNGVCAFINASLKGKAVDTRCFNALDDTIKPCPKWEVRR